MPSPNDNFTAGQILTDTECNQFPRGVMAFNTVITTDSTITSEEVQITGSSFTAVANRLYKITYYEPETNLQGQGLGDARIRLSSISGAVQNSQLIARPLSGAGFVHVSAVSTLTAGTTNFVATLSSTSGTMIASRSATSYAFLLVEDIGPV